MDTSSREPLAEAAEATRRMKRSCRAFLVVLGLLLLAFLALLQSLSTASSGWLLPELGDSVYLAALALVGVVPALIYSFATGVSVVRTHPVVWFWLVPEALLVLLVLFSIALEVFAP